MGVQSEDENPPHPTYHRIVLLVDADNERRKIELPELPSEQEAQRLAAWIEQSTS